MKISHRLMLDLACILAAVILPGCDSAIENNAGAAPAASPATRQTTEASPRVLNGPDSGGPPASESQGASPRMLALGGRDLFAGKSWFVPPPPVPTPAPKPVAPPFPYVFTGGMRDASHEGHTVLFISQGERNFIVRKGETVGAQYRLDDIGETEAVFTYLPLQEKQRMAFGNPK